MDLFRNTQGNDFAVSLFEEIRVFFELPFESRGAKILLLCAGLEGSLVGAKIYFVFVWVCLQEIPK